MLIIKNVHLVNPKTNFDSVTDIEIKDSKIVKIGPSTNEGEIIDGTNLYAAPGLIDVHVHFRDPGLTYKEDIITGSNAAKKGGFTTVITMANTKPVVDNVETVKYIIEKGKQTGIHVLPAACITKDMKQEQLVDFKALIDAGAVGFTDDGLPIKSQELTLEAMKEAVKYDMPLSFHEEDPAFINQPGVNYGEVSKALNHQGAKAMAEDIMVARDVMLALETGAKVNIQHISSGRSVKLVQLAKEFGANVYAEATPHHFSLTEEAVLKHGTFAKMNPPLRTAKDRDMIIEGLKNGTIDIIATDHAPHSAEEKNQELTKAPSGIIGLETSLALGITNLVLKNHLSMMQLIEKMTINPAKLYNLDSGSIEEGKLADLVLFNIDEPFKIEKYESKAINTPFTNETLYGKVKYTICEGKIVYKD